MSYQDFLISQALMSSRGNKARCQRRSRRASERRAARACPRKPQVQEN